MLGLASVASSLLDLDVLIVDCQTTGATPGQGCVLELGWCVARANLPEPAAPAQAHWIALPPGERVSPPVRLLTGFHEGVLVDALEPEQAWRQLRGSIDTRLPTPTPSPASRVPMPAAIHFARFELAFLRDWSKRFDCHPDGEFPIEAVCVHAIACRLYPDLPRRNLRALAGFLGHGLHLERRALGHVLATAFIWRKLAVSLAERGITSWPELTRWLAEPVAPRAPRRRTYPIPSARYRRLPDVPGVYRLLRSNGDVLYVGKAKSLKKRVASHFGKQRGATERALEMLTQVNEVEFQVTATALEAAMLETELIKALDPPYNVQLVAGERGAWFASSDLASTSPRPDERHRIGPLPSRFSVRCLRGVVELLAGEAPTPARRAAAVGAPGSFAPDAEIFAAGWARFAERRLADLPCLPASDPRGVIMQVARALLLEATEGDGDSADQSGEAPGPAAAEGPSAASAPVWDPERVCRHVERSLAAAYQVLRRSGWLCVLANSSVYFREPGPEAGPEPESKPKLESESAPGRLLLIENAELKAGIEATADVAVPVPPPRPSRFTLQELFDAARYDQLRILTSELKRIDRDGGEVVVRLSRGCLLECRRLRDILRLV